MQSEDDYFVVTKSKIINEMNKYFEKAFSKIDFKNIDEKKLFGDIQIQNSKTYVMMVQHKENKT